MRINSSGNITANGNLTVANGVGIGTNTINSSYQLQLPHNASYTTQLRCEGGSGIIPLSIGGSGNIYVDAPGVVGGRFTILNGGNVGIGNPSPSAPLWIGRPDVASIGYLVISQNTGGNRNFKMGYDSSYNFAFGDYGNTNGTNTWTEQVSIAYTAPANSLTMDGSGNINVGGATKINSTLTASGNIKGNQYYCTISFVPLSYQSAIGTGGTWFLYIFLNNWWYLGYSYLIVSASIVMAGNNTVNTYCWNGRVF